MRPVLKGKLRIGRYMNSDVEKPIYISITDINSGADFLRVEISPQELINATLGSSEGRCDFTVNGLEFVGKYFEIKHILVDIPPAYQKYPSELDDAIINSILQPYQVDGWMGEGYNLENVKNYSQDYSKCKVTFIRYINEPPVKSN